MTLDKDRNGALGISIAGGLGSPTSGRPVIIAYAQGQAASRVSVSFFFVDYLVETNSFMRTRLYLTYLFCILLYQF